MLINSCKPRLLSLDSQSFPFVLRDVSLFCSSRIWQKINNDNTFYYLFCDQLELTLKRVLVNKSELRSKCTREYFRLKMCWLSSAGTSSPNTFATLSLSSVVLVYYINSVMFLTTRLLASMTGLFSALLWRHNQLFTACVWTQFTKTSEYLSCHSVLLKCLGLFYVAWLIQVVSQPRTSTWPEEF